VALLYFMMNPYPIYKLSPGKIARKEKKKHNGNQNYVIYSKDVELMKFLSRSPRISGRLTKGTFNWIRSGG